MGGFEIEPKPCCSRIGTVDFEMVTPDRQECGDCGAVRALQYYCCVACGMMYCDECWDRSPAHRFQLAGRRRAGFAHEKSDPKVARKILGILDTEHCTAARQALLHEQDSETCWFGIMQNPDSGALSFGDLGRYAHLAKQLSQGQVTRFPAIVSFVV